MNKKIVVWAGVVVFICILGYTAHTHTQNQKNSLTFTNTQTWDAELEHLQYQTPTIIGDAYKEISITDAPVNTSSITKKDLEVLHDDIQLRDEETLARINAERKLVNAYFGEKTYGEIISTTTMPYTSYFIQESLHELSFLIIKFKSSYNRVRPSYLDPTLTTTIDVPQHPSYPSGHATESYFVALMLSELDPDNAETYREAAYRIAKGREIAGVHYPTDSEAGRSLATQYFDILKETPWYKTHLDFAKREWQEQKN